MQYKTCLGFVSLAPENHLKVRDKRLQSVLCLSVSEQRREDRAKRATE